MNKCLFEANLFISITNRTILASKLASKGVIVDTPLEYKGKMCYALRDNPKSTNYIDLEVFCQIKKFELENSIPMSIIYYEIKEICNDS